MASCKASRVVVMAIFAVIMLLMSSEVPNALAHTVTPKLKLGRKLFQELPPTYGTGPGGYLPPPRGL